MKQSRRIYRQDISLKDALHRWHDFLKGIHRTEAEHIPVEGSLGRTTASAVFAAISSPFFHSAAMDGYAVPFHETFGASETTPVKLKIDDTAVEVNTGEPLPGGCNAVIMIEEIHRDGDYIIINSPATPYQHVRTVGEDIVQTELILPENHLVRPIDIGAMLAGGITGIGVRRKPLVRIILTGNEIIAPGEPLSRGRIIDFDSYMIGAMVLDAGGDYTREEIIPDNKELLKEVLSNSLNKCDFIVVIAGSSAGTRDFTPDVIAEMGDIILHGIRIKPGKPVLLGSIEGKPVIGLPGYPVSAYITFELFGLPLILHLLGRELPRREELLASLSRPVTSPPGSEEFLRVKVGKVGDKYMSTPVGRGAGAVMTLQRADGIVRVPEMSEGLAAETRIKVTLMKDREEIENNIVCIGSHDNCIDLLANRLKQLFPGYSLSSAHVGSMGGLVAVKKGQAHMAGTHLLDETSGEYNVPFIKKFLKGIPLTLINLVYRQQGLIVQKGNPGGITGIGDLTGEGLVFINRQRGSGTRLLTDKCLKDEGIDPADIEGYAREEFTHMGVASAVASGVADAGMGIITAAISLGLEFVPVARERYDIVVKNDFLDLPPFTALLSIIRSDEEFREMVNSLGGYDTSDMGRVVYEQST